MVSVTAHTPRFEQILRAIANDDLLEGMIFGVSSVTTPEQVKGSYRTANCALCCVYILYLIGNRTNDLSRQYGRRGCVQRFLPVQYLYISIDVLLYIS